MLLVPVVVPVHFSIRCVSAHVEADSVRANDQ
jgi:hypothetical protein